MILVAPTSFKGTISARDAAAALAAGARAACPDEEIIEMPVSDGGPGLIDALTAARGGELRTTRVHDPLGRLVDARILLLELDDGLAAIVECADACGMHLLDGAELDPMRLGSFGVGELIAAASRLADTVVLGLGGSATVDGGVGMATALGWRFVDADGNDLGLGGAVLRRLHDIRAPSARAAVAASAPSAASSPGAAAHRARPRVIALADVSNPLLGRDGAARVFAPQKGATPADVEVLEEGLARLADVVRRDVGTDIAAPPGTGAAGGLGGAAVAFLGAQLVPGADWLLDAVDFDAKLARASLVVTGEGSFDAQSSMGKVTGEVIARAGRAAVRVLLVAGHVDGPVPVHVVAPGEREMLDGAALRRIARQSIIEIVERKEGRHDEP